MSNILFAAYHREEVEFIAALLQEKGHTVTVINDGVEAMDTLRKSAVLPDLLVVHWMLPNMDGEEIVLRLAKEFPGFTMRILFVTVMLPLGEPFRDWKMPISSFLFAPYSRWQLLLSIEQLLFRDVSAPS